MTLADCDPCFSARAQGQQSAPESCRACFAIRTRNPRSRSGNTLQADYAEEYAYVTSRRAQLGLTPPLDLTVPANLQGVAMSGGGIRSASFNLGALQALLDAGALDQFDYMSAVSGGGYLAGWVQNHLGAQQQLYRDELGYEVGTDKISSLLDNSGDQVEQLRTHTRFVQGSSWFEGPKVFLQWLVRWPAHVVMDDVLHLRGVWDWPHILDIYQARIEDTYFRGTPPPASTVPNKAEMPLVEVNDATRSAITPYMVLNANLSNTGRSQVGTPPDDPSQWNFEFTRDFVGSDGTGYVDARGFDRSVDYVLLNRAKQPAAVVVDLDGHDASPFRLSTAVASSGAAFDSLAGVNQLHPFKDPPLNEIGQIIGGSLLNLHLGFDAPNFSRTYNGAAVPLGYFAMMTWQREARWVGTGATWLHITDGGHYENLGSLALLRRDAKCVVQFDVGADPDAEYGDLHVLRQRLESDLGMHWITALPQKGDARGRYRFEVGDTVGGGPTAVILYVKANANTDLPHMQANFGASSAARRAALERAVATIEEDDLRTLQTAADAARPTSHPVADLDAALRDAEDRTAAYYGAVLEDRRNSESRQRIARDAVTAAEKELADGEALLASLQGHQIALCRSADDLCQATIEAADPSQATDLSGAAVVALTKLCADRGVAEQPDLRRCPAPSPYGRAVDLSALSVETVAQSYDTNLLRNWDDLQKQRRENAERQTRLSQARQQLVLANGPSPDVDDKQARRLRADNALADVIEKRSASTSSIAQELKAGVRRHTVRMRNALIADRDWNARVEERKERIRKITDYAVSTDAKDFPHTDTIIQWYEWERFEAYRLLGYQMASTYLTAISPDSKPGAGTDPMRGDLDWCKFAEMPPGEEDAPGK